MLSSDWLTKGKGDSDGWVNHVRTPIILIIPPGLQTKHVRSNFRAFIVDPKQIVLQTVTTFLLIKFKKTYVSNTETRIKIILL